MTNEEALDLFRDRFDGLLIAGLTLKVEQYPNGRPALQAFTEEWEPWCMVTVNLPDERLEPGEFFVHHSTREYDEPGLLRAIEEAGLARFTGRTVSAGFVEKYAEVWSLVGEG